MKVIGVKINASRELNEKRFKTVLTDNNRTKIQDNIAVKSLVKKFLMRFPFKIAT